MNRYAAADPVKFAAATEVTITKDHDGKVWYAMAVDIDGNMHGVVASTGALSYSKDDLNALVAMHWQALADDGHIGRGQVDKDWHDKLVTLTGDPLQDHLQVAYAAANQSH